MFVVFLVNLLCVYVLCLYILVSKQDKETVAVETTACLQ